MERRITTHSVSEIVLNKRNEIAEAINNPHDNLISIMGPCPMVDDEVTIFDEAKSKKASERKHDNLIVIDRQCFTKPRTNPADWQGLDSTDPETAQEIIGELSEDFANVSAEIRFDRNLTSYANMLSFIWTGARNIEDDNLFELISQYDHSLPVGVKNGLDGGIDSAIKRVNEINNSRPQGSAPAVLIYRGGENAKSPNQLEENYILAYERTEGRIIRDNAHGVEMAYHPDAEFKKSAEGQIQASMAGIELAKQGLSPLGVMYEASQQESIMDPHIPLESAIKHTEMLYEAKFGSIATTKLVQFENLPHHGFGSKRITTQYV